MDALDETSRQYLLRTERVADMMATMYAILHDRYARWAAVAQGVVMVGSLLACVLSLARKEVVELAGLTDTQAGAAAALASIVVFALALLMYKHDWSALARDYEQARKAHADLKWRAKECLAAPPEAAGPAEIRRRHHILCETCRPVPDKQFLPLKAAHYRKVQMSRLLDKHPSASRWAIGASMWWRQTHDACVAARTSRVDAAPDSPEGVGLVRATAGGTPGDTPSGGAVDGPGHVPEGDAGVSAARGLQGSEDGGH